MNSVIRSVLDIGTNAVKYVVVEIRDDGLETLLESERISRLGEGSLESNLLQPDAIRRTLAAIEDLLAEGELFRPSSTDAIGTQALRRAENRNDFIRELRERFGLRLRVLTGNEEAVASFMAARAEIANGPLAILDMGGGSAEIAFGELDRPTYHVSFPVGGRQLLESVPVSDPPTQSELEKIAGKVRSETRELKPLGEDTRLLLVGGAAHALAGYARALMGAPGELVAVEMYDESLERLIQLLSEVTLEERRELPGAHPDRADVIVHAAVAIHELMHILHKTKALTANLGLGHGVLEAERRGVALDPKPAMYTIPGMDFRPVNRPNRRGEVLFLLRRPDGKIWLQTKETYQDGLYRIPGGGLDVDEAPGDALYREVQEETGYENFRALKLGRMQYTLPDGWTVPFTSYVYLIEVGDDPPENQDPEEGISGYRAVSVKSFDEWVDAWEALDEEYRAWGVFRAAAFRFSQELAFRGAL